MRGTKYINLVNPLYYIRKSLMKKNEDQQWGIFNEQNIDFLKMNEDKIPGHVRYQITRPNHIPFIKEFLEDNNISQSDSIVDIGCGKGGMLYFFSNYNFGKIAGLEYSMELCKICNSNIRELNIGNAIVINGDACIYNDYNEYNYFYLYNPFNEEISNKFLANLMNSLIEMPRKVYVIYTNALYADLFIKKGFVIIKEFKTSVLFKEKAFIFTNNKK